MWNELIKTVKGRAIFMLLLIHGGFAAAVVLLVHLTQAGAPREQVYGLLGCLGVIYVGFFGGLYFTLQPFTPWVHRLRMMMNWRRMLIEYWPLIVKLLPEVLETIRGLVHTFKETFGQEASASEKKSTRTRKPKADAAD